MMSCGAKHAPLAEFAEHAIRTPLHFVPGSKYQYSSMAILLATRVAELISGTDILTLVDRAVFQPLKMQHSAQGLGRFKLEDMVPCQTESRGSGSRWRRSQGEGLGLEQSLLAQTWRALGRHPCLGAGCRKIPGRVPE